MGRLGRTDAPAAALFHMKTILCVSHVAPWPASHGNELRLKRLLTWLRMQSHRVVLVLTSSQAAAGHEDVIRNNVDRLEIVHPSHPLLRPRTAAARCGTVLRRLRARVQGARPASGPESLQQLADRICPQDVTTLVTRLAAEEHVDVYYAYYAFTVQAFGGITDRKRIVCDTVELFSMQRHDGAGKILAHTLSATPEEERAILQPSRHIIAIQEVEAGYLRSLMPEHSISTVGVDFEPPVSPGLPSESAAVVGIVGSDNRANVDGLRLFLDESWPAIRGSVPQARLRIAGKLGAAARLHEPDAQRDGVETVGWLSRIADFYESTRIVVNPVRTGTGLKIKTVEALAHGRPVVAHPIGLEGVQWPGEQAWWSVADGQAMAEACITLLTNPERCDAMARAAKIFASEALSAANVYAPLSHVIDTIDAE